MGHDQPADSVRHDAKTPSPDESAKHVPAFSPITEAEQMSWSHFDIR
jgi:hypothetical protein